MSNSEQIPHGQEGHVNVYRLDQESVLTNYGEHFRVVAFLPDHEGLFCRVDHKHGKRMPYIFEILRVAKKDQGIAGKWELCKEEISNCGKFTEFYFKNVSWFNLSNGERS